MYSKDHRIVMTLDAGGTNFVFSAIQGGECIVSPITLSSNAGNLERCLHTLKKGFTAVANKLSSPAVAISFAFPGPADYINGVIGDLPNFPSFRGGVALKAFLENQFKIPVFVNNDGNLFAYGEALCGILPQINKELKEAGSKKHYRNLLGITFGTGFGAGVVLNQQLLLGDNGCGGDIWCFRNKKYDGMIVEESVSIRAIKRVYCAYSGDVGAELTPKDIFDIAEGRLEGNREAAIRSFTEFGEMAGDAIAQAATIVDGLIVLGGGITGAANYILPSLIREMNRSFSTFSGNSFPRMQMDVYNLMNDVSRKDFLLPQSQYVKVPESAETAVYESNKRIGVAVSTLGASKAIALGAYTFALHSLDEGGD